MHYSYQKHRISLCLTWTCLITKRLQDRGAREHLREPLEHEAPTPPLTSTCEHLSFFHSGPAHSSITLCCWDQACPRCRRKTGNWAAGFSSSLSLTHSCLKGEPLHLALCAPCALKPSNTFTSSN